MPPVRAARDRLIQISFIRLFMNESGRPFPFHGHRKSWISRSNWGEEDLHDEVLISAVFPSRAHLAESGVYHDGSAPISFSWMQGRKLDGFTPRSVSLTWSTFEDNEFCSHTRGHPAKIDARSSRGRVREMTKIPASTKASRNRPPRCCGCRRTRARGMYDADTVSRYQEGR